MTQDFGNERLVASSELKEAPRDAEPDPLTPSSSHRKTSVDVKRGPITLTPGTSVPTSLSGILPGGVLREVLRNRLQRRRQRETEVGK